MNCRICGANRVETFLDLGDQPHCNRLVAPSAPAEAEPRYPLRVGFCHGCTLVQIDHTIPKEQMFSDYPYVSGTTKTLVAHFRETADRLIAQYRLGPDSLVVDIGSNDGSWLAQYGDRTRVLGVEAAANVAELALARSIPTLNEFFDEATAKKIAESHGRASLITAAGVFFHLEDLHSVVRGINHLLNDDGVFVVQAIYLGGMIENVAFDQVYHEHLCYYTLRSIEALFELHGLQVVHAGVVPIHGGSLEVHVARRGARQVDANVQAMRNSETTRGYAEFATYQRFAERVWTLRDALLKVLAEMKASGLSVHAYGAPAKGATLLNTFKIDQSLVQAAEERNPMKIGYMMPGARIPIIAEGEPRPDAYLVLAWNFIDEFLTRETTYLEQGGRFLVPIPELRLITQAGTKVLQSC